MGAVSPLGVGVEANWQALMAGKSGIVMNDRFDVTDFAAKIAGLPKPRGCICRGGSPMPSATESGNIEKVSIVISRPFA